MREYDHTAIRFKAEVHARSPCGRCRGCWSCATLESFQNSSRDKSCAQDQGTCRKDVAQKSAAIDKVNPVHFVTPAAVLMASRIREAIRDTFTVRGTHSPPDKFPKPPAEWTTAYELLAKDQNLPWKSLVDVEQAAREFLDPVLDDAAVTTWDPEHWRWNTD